ncbi:hypothetical protein K432DRAFT_253193, partial [Lepidopterella palustris CBS 459.81]
MCEIIEVSLDDLPPFEALSYTWGGQEPDIPLSINGKDLKVTPNAEEFLFYQRSIFGPRYFWIDAICINQDCGDKEGQLPHMTEIYKKASRVLVWLGPPQSIWQARGLDMAIQISEFCRIVGDVTTPGGDLIFNGLLNEEFAFEALGALFRHGWFERMWVIQE